MPELPGVVITRRLISPFVCGIENQLERGFARPLNFSYPTCLAIATEEIAVAHQIFRSSCSITPASPYPRRCRSASPEAERRRAYRVAGHARRKFIRKTNPSWQDRPSGDGADSYQQALRHRARHGRGGRDARDTRRAPVAKPGFRATES